MHITCKLCNSTISSMLVDKTAAGDLGIQLTKHVQFRHASSFKEYLQQINLLLPMIPYYVMMREFGKLDELPEEIETEVNKCAEILTGLLYDDDGDDSEDVGIAPLKLEVTDEFSRVSIKVDELWVPILTCNEVGEKQIDTELIESIIYSVIKPETEVTQ